MVRMVGPMSKRKPFSSSDRRLPAQPGVPLEERHPVATRGERDRRGEPAQPRADDADPIRGFRHGFTPL